MGISQDRGTRPELAENIQNLIDRTPLLTASVKLAIRIGPGSPFSEAVVGFFVHFMLATDQGDILFTFAHVLPAFDHDRTQAKLYQAKGGKQTTRSRSYHHDRFPGRHVFIFHRPEFRFIRHLINKSTQLDIHKDSPLTCIDGTLQHTDSVNVRDRCSRFTGYHLLQRLFADCLFGQYTKL